MKQELDLDYEISGDKMLDMTQEHESESFKLTEAVFMINHKKSFKEHKVMVLSNESDINASDIKQIFRMKDGKFILEIENDEGIEYFYSTELSDLTK